MHILDDLTDADRARLKKGVRPISRKGIVLNGVDSHGWIHASFAPAVLEQLVAAAAPALKSARQRAALKRLQGELDAMQGTSSTSREVKELLHPSPSDEVAARAAGLKRVPWRAG